MKKTSFPNDPARTGMVDLPMRGVPANGSGPRERKEPSHPFRSASQRDRARIIHCSSFRRLDGRTQVFLNGSGDHYRTRLTHTMEVASISRTIARALRLNEDLAEAISLAHDLGHPPCGHTGEEALDRLLRQHGGFDHNAQSLRIVEVLEEKYPGHHGLNLTWDVREGIQKHADGYSHPVSGLRYPSPSLEAQVSDLADEIAYSSHDLDDGLDASLLDTSSLAEVTLWCRALDRAREEYPRTDPDVHRGFVIRCLVNLLVEDLVAHTGENLEASRISTLEDVRSHSKRLAGFTPPIRNELAALRKFLFKNLYHHPDVAGANRRASEKIAALFGVLMASPSKLGRKATARIRRDGLERSVGDYISGMTDRYLARQHGDLVEASSIRCGGGRG